MQSARMMNITNLERYVFPSQCQAWVKHLSFTRCYSKDPGYGNQLGGFEYKEDIEGFRSKWRVPFHERIGFTKSFLSAFGSKKFPGERLKYNPENLRFFNFKQWWANVSKNKIIFDQGFSEERLGILGNDLAAAHFVVFRGGSVKFYNHPDWIKDDTAYKKEYDTDLPNTYDPNYIVEGLDLSGTCILYEGLQNIENLRKLKWLSFSKCPLFDDWCLDRISGEYGKQLEYLDISNTKVSYCGFNALYRFQNLKTLKVDDASNNVEFYKMLMEILNTLPELTIVGLPEVILNELVDGKKEESRMLSN